MADEYLTAALYGMKRFNEGARKKIKDLMGIEKLIGLLNEYDSGWDYDDYYGPYQYGQDRDAYHLCKYQLVSKEYGFIEWLVENDKIDLDKLEKKVLKENLIRKFDEGLLMLLSISSSPIEDLISYLK